MEDSLNVNPHLLPRERLPAGWEPKYPRVVINYKTLTDEHSGPYVDYTVWSAYFGVNIDAVKRHARDNMIPSTRDMYGLKLHNPAWHLTWRDKKWNGRMYVSDKADPGYRSGLSFGVVDPRVGERTTGRPE